MRSAIGAIVAAALALGVDAAQQKCNPRNNCNRAVIAHAFPTREATIDCSSFLAALVTDNRPSLPTYARRACDNRSSYSSACSCAGITSGGGATTTTPGRSTGDNGGTCTGAVTVTVTNSGATLTVTDAGVGTTTTIPGVTLTVTNSAATSTVPAVTLTVTSGGGTITVTSVPVPVTVTSVPLPVTVTSGGATLTVTSNAATVTVTSSAATVTVTNGGATVTSIVDVTVTSVVPVISEVISLVTEILEVTSTLPAVISLVTEVLEVTSTLPPVISEVISLVTQILSVTEILSVTSTLPQVTSIVTLPQITDISTLIPVAGDGLFSLQEKVGGVAGGFLDGLAVGVTQPVAGLATQFNLDPAGHLYVPGQLASANLYLGVNPTTGVVSFLPALNLGVNTRPTCQITPATGTTPKILRCLVGAALTNFQLCGIPPVAGVLTFNGPVPSFLSGIICSDIELDVVDVGAL